MRHSARHAAVAIAIAALALAGCDRDNVETTATTPAVDEPVTPTSPANDPLMPSTATPAPLATGDDNDGVADGAETALDVTSVTLGTDAGPDLRITDPATTFGTDGPVIVSVDTAGAASDAEIGVRLVYQDGQNAAEQTETVSTTGVETTNFTFTNARAWPAGEYTAEIRINGTLADSRSFNIR